MAPVPISDDKTCILVLGDFLGTGMSQPEDDGVTWTPVPATPDSVMKLAGLRPRIRLAPDEDGHGEAMVLSSLQSLDPGEIFQNADRFASWREARERAKSGEDPFQVPDNPVPPLSSPEVEDGAGLLDSILDSAQPHTPAPEPGSPEEIQAFAREVVRPHLVKDDSDIKTRVAAVDEAISRAMSALIHTASFQRVEAIWRSVVFLLSRLDATGKVRVYLVHLPKERLARDLAQGSSSAPRHLRDLLRSPQLGVPGRRWSMVVGAYDLAFTANDIHLLAEMAPLAREADVPLITSLGLPGDDESAPREGEEDPGLRWGALRASPSASWLGVTYPRFLLREPFGEGAKQVKPFHFKEETPSRDAFLWGSGAFVAATLLAQSLLEGHRAPGSDSGLELLGMPHGSLQEGSEEPPSSLEFPLTPDDVRTFLGIGVMPLFAIPGRASVRLGGFQSVMEPRNSLSAWWRR